MAQDGRSDEMEDRYRPAELEPRWQAEWEKAGVFQARRESARPKYYVLEMFPYPSGRLHMGHVRNYSIGDVVARTRRMMGFEVLHPMGWDAFGLPAENAAIKAKVHPRAWTFENIRHMREQFVRLGLSYDWSRELTTCEPGYFVYEQRIFIEMWKRGLAYRKGAVVNWCPSCATVLANEQVEDGLCWRCRSVVQERELEQWFLKVTDYADELLRDLARLRGKWPDKILAMQENWIGRSEGARIRFSLERAVGDTKELEVFTTRPDTLYGVTFLSIAAEHPLASRLAKDNPALAAFIARIRGEDKIRRGAEDYVKEGMDTGVRAVHPLTGLAVPVWVANFVLMEYGTGAVMAVPAHDQRDFEFARKYSLPVRIVIQPPSDFKMETAFTEPGKMVNSGPFDGVESEAGKKQVTALLTERGAGGETVSYRIRDWLVSRQRFWGAPIPMVKCETHGYQPVPEAELPVTLPEDVTLAEGGRSPLATHPSWAKTTCPVCGGPAERETDTMDGFVESSWYAMRYAAPGPGSGGWLDRAELDHFMPVDQYIGGAEHATKHLIYARFFTKMLRDWGWVAPGLDEPFTRLLAQGMVCKETYRCPEHDYLFPDEVTAERTCARCGKPVAVGRVEKMSKSLKNVVEPLPLIEKYGADTVRVFSLFAAPPDSVLEWSEAGVEGAWRFLNRVWRLVADKQETRTRDDSVESDIRQKTHATIKRVTDDVGGDRFHFNTAISGIMELVNAIYAVPTLDRQEGAGREAVEAVVALLAPIAPHLAEELWHRLGHTDLLAAHPWPSYDPQVAAKKRIPYPVQVNGKLRGQVEAEPEATQATIEPLARALAPVAAALEGKQVVKIVFVPGRLINFVVR